MSEKSTKTLLRILMLHGYTQNAAVFNDRTGGLRKSLKQIAEFVYCDAPFDVPKFISPEQEDSKEDENEKDQPSKGWYTKTLKSDPVKDVDKSLDYLNDVFKQQGPFDGVWGFSQGATMTHFLVNTVLDNRNNPTNNNSRNSIDFKFAILTATSKSAHPFLAGFEDRFYRKECRLDMSSLFIIGKMDRITEYSKALELTEYYERPKVYVHEKGHFIPTDKESKQVYSEFLNEIRVLIK